jgi:hypothetical protein
MQQKAMEAKPRPPKPAPELKHLDEFVGTWNTQWRATDNSSNSTFKTIGTDRYEWLPGGFFLIHHVDVHMEDEDYKVIEIIGGYDAASQTYPMRSFDSRGSIQEMTAAVSAEGVWRFVGKTMRATLIGSADGNTKTAKWERSSDGLNWLPWMEMKFTKAG